MQAACLPVSLTERRVNTAPIAAKTSRIIVIAPYMNRNAIPPTMLYLDI